jgi:pimeloyl-ACP methyl ester carboxylesterase
MEVAFTRAHRGGSGPPLVLLHGITDTWRTWDLVLDDLQRDHEVLAPTLLGHAGGPPLTGELTDASIADAVQRAMDDAGLQTAHLVGNSLGGYVALQLAMRGRARSVVALAPAGGWPPGDAGFHQTQQFFREMRVALDGALPRAEWIVSTPQGRRRATEHSVTHFEHIPPELIFHQMHGAAECPGLEPILEMTRREGWRLDRDRITCPVRVVWGTADRILPWPATAARFQTEWVPDADWVVLDGIGHCPQLDVPERTAELIADFAARRTG